MTDLTLRGLSPEMLVRLGDEAIRAGEYRLARTLFQSAWAASPNIPTASRLGLLQTLNLAETPKLFDVLQAAEAAGINAFVGSGLATWHKMVPGMEDVRFRELVDRHAKLLPLANWHWNLGVVVWAVRQARHLPGDFVELGVFRGHTTLFVAEYLDFADWPKRWRLYDTFAGIPEDQLDPGWENANADAYSSYGYEEVRARFAHFPNIEVIQGRVPEILAERPPGQIAFLHVDLTNTVAEIAALDALYDQITPGGVIVFDDFCWSVAKAQYAAEKAWFERRGLSVLALPTGQGLFVKPAAG